MDKSNTPTKYLSTLINNSHRTVFNQDMRAAMRGVVTKFPSGPSEFSTLVNEAHKQFFGTGLSESKINKYCSQILGVENSHVFKSLSEKEVKKSKPAIEIVSEKLKGICSREDDDFTDNTFFDFYSPVFLKPESHSTRPERNIVETETCWRCKDCDAEWSFVMGDDVPDVCPYCCLEESVYTPPQSVGVLTLVEIQHDTKRIKVTQKFKGYNDEYAEFEDFALVTQNSRDGECDIRLSAKHADVTIPYSPEYLSGETLKRLKESGRADMVELASKWQAKEKWGDFDINLLMASFLRSVQTLELQRVINALGVVPMPDYSGVTDGLSLFSGYVYFGEIERGVL